MPIIRTRRHYEKNGIKIEEAIEIDDGEAFSFGQNYPAFAEESIRVLRANEEDMVLRAFKPRNAEKVATGQKG